MDNTIWAWYWAIDNVHIWAPLMLDAELVGVHLPPGNCGFSSSEIIAVDIHNSGLDTLNGYAVSYQINGGNPVTEMAMLQVLSGDTGTYVFNTVANLSGAGSYTVRAWVSLVGDGDLSNDTLLPLSIVNHPKVSVFPHFEDYEAGAGDWVAGGTNASWAWGTPAKSVIVGAASGSKAWVTGGTGMMGYNNYEESWVESPCFDLSTVSNPWVGLDVWWNSEFSFDGAVLQATSDGGVTWQRIGMFGDGYNWYTDNGIDGLPGGQNNGWTGRAASMNGSNGYRRAVHDLIAFGGASEVIFRLAFASDFSVSDDGFAWDNFTLAQRPFINLGPDRVVCDSFVLDAGLADSYLWTTGDTSRLLTVDSSGSYSVEIRDSFGFPVSDQVLVTILKTGDLNLGEDTLLCGATFFSLLADPGGQSFLWSTGDTLPGLQVSNSGIYSVMVTYGPGCIDMDTVSIDFSSLQAGIVLATDTVCTNTFVSFLDGSTGAISWLWDFGDGNFSLNANPIHAYSSGGTYLVSLMVTDSFCTDSVVLPVFADICTGLEGRGNLVGIQLGPNPARDLTFLYMNVGGSGTAEMEVLDLLGRQIMRKNWFLEAGEQRKKVDLHGLSSGIYLLRVHFDGLIYEQKLWILEE
ncbi:MAG TPA: T9SS type A sorting domain-containing protein [Bacteroidetes bacterium]|nr:T9SS type A sorting domain-containing protein [Bacteroidota bacterium]